MGRSITPAVLRAHMSANWIRKPCHLGGIQGGDGIKSGCLRHPILSDNTRQPGDTTLFVLRSTEVGTGS